MFSLLLLSSFSFSSSSLPLTVIQVTIRFISDQSTLGLFLPAFWVISTSMQAPLPTPSPHGFLNLLISTDLQPPLHLSTYNQFQSTLTTTLPQLGLSDCGQKQPPEFQPSYPHSYDAHVHGLLCDLWPFDASDLPPWISSLVCNCLLASPLSTPAWTLWPITWTLTLAPSTPWWAEGTLHSSCPIFLPPLSLVYPLRGGLLKVKT